MIAEAAVRRRHRDEVEALLEQIRDGVQDVLRLKARGLRGRALAERKQEIAGTRRRLAALVGR